MQIKLVVTSFIDDVAGNKSFHRQQPIKDAHESHVVHDTSELTTVLGGTKVHLELKFILDCSMDLFHSL